MVPNDLAPPELPTAYVTAVLNAHRSEEIAAARALGLLLEGGRRWHGLRTRPGHPPWRRPIDRSTRLVRDVLSGRGGRKGIRCARQRLLGSVPSWIRRHVVTETGDRLMGLGRG